MTTTSDHTQTGRQRKVVLSFAYLFLITAAFIVGRISRDTLALEFGSIQTFLAYLYVGVSIAILVAVYGYNRLGNYLPREQLAGLSLMQFGLGAMIMRFVLGQTPGAVWLYYIWVDVFGALSLIQCWSLLGDIFDARESRKFFPMIGLGGVLANIVCGFGITRIVAVVGAQNLIALMSLLIFFALLTQQWLSTIAYQELSHTRTAHKFEWRRFLSDSWFAPSFGAIFDNRYLKLIALIVAITFFTTTLVDYDFKLTLAHALPTSAARAQYLGLFYGVCGLLSGVIQLFLTGFLINRWGLRISLMLLPAFMVTGAFFTLLSPGIVGVTWTKGAEHILRYTLYDAGMQLLYVPLSQDLRARAKAHIEGVLKPGVILLAGVLLIVYAPLSGFIRLPWIYALGLVAWLFALLGIKRQYVKALMRTLRRGHWRGQDESGFSLRDFLEAALAKGEGLLIEQSLAYATSSTSGADSAVKRMIENHLSQLLRHELPSVRLKTLAYCAAHDVTCDLVELRRLINTGDDETRAQALLCLSKLGAERALDILTFYLKSPTPCVRAAAIIGLIKHSGMDGILSAVGTLKAMTSSSDPHMREQAAIALGSIGIRHFYQPLLGLLHDQDWRVRLRAISAAQAVGADELLPALIYQLSHLRSVETAVMAIASYGERVVPLLSRVLREEREHQDIRRNIPKILARIGTQSALNSLLSLVNIADPNIRFQILRALLRLHGAHPDIELTEPHIIRSVKQELMDYYEFAVMELELSLDEEDALLKDAIRHHRQRDLGRVFLLLGLIYPTSVLTTVQMNLASSSKRRRANAIEVLENLLESGHKRLLMPLFESVHHHAETQVPFTLSAAVSAVLPSSGAPLAQSGVSTMIVTAHGSRNSWLSLLLHGADTWLCALAIEMIGRKRITHFITPIKAMTTEHTSPLVRETALAALKKLCDPREYAQIAAHCVADSHPGVRKWALIQMKESAS